MSDKLKRRFEKAAAQGNQRLVVDYLWFLSQNKKYWMIPILAILLLIGFLVILGGSSAGAFIYTMF